MKAVVCCSCVKVNVFCWYQWELFMAGMRIIKGHNRHTVRPLLHVRVTLALSYPLKNRSKKKSLGLSHVRVSYALTQGCPFRFFTDDRHLTHRL